MVNIPRQCVGDFIVYYEPRREDADDRGRAGRQAYFAAARVREIIEDPGNPDRFYALIDDYIDFTEAVPFRVGAEFFEKNLRKQDGSTNRGAFGRAVRVLSDGEYEAIFQAGFGHVIEPVKTQIIADRFSGLEETIAEFERPVREQLVKRPFRDSAFAKNVTEAYNFTCALTGLKIINGNGRPEIEAAHIQPVGDGHNGPDSVRNGIGLSRTAHWMFDRGLVTVSDEFQILISSRLQEDAKRLLNPSGEIRIPDFNLN